MKNIFLVFGLILSVTLGASELFAQSNGRKKRDAKKPPSTKVESKRSRKSADDSRGKKERGSEMHSKSKRGGDGGRSDRESRDKNADVPPRSMERMRQHSNSRVDQKGVGRDHGGQHRRGHSEWDRRGDRPSTGHRGHERSARGEDRERPSASRRDAQRRRGSGDFSREMRSGNSDHDRKHGVERSRSEDSRRGRGGRSQEMDRGPQSQRGGRDLKSSRNSPRGSSDVRRGKPEAKHRGTRDEKPRGRK
jgi:hypothetical protein